MPRVSLNSDRAIRERQQILYDRYGGFMTTANLMKELGVSRMTAMKFESDLPSYNWCGHKVFDIRDVAKKLEGGRTPPESVTE